VPPASHQEELDKSSNLSSLPTHEAISPGPLKRKDLVTLLKHAKVLNGNILIYTSCAWNKKPPMFSAPKGFEVHIRDMRRCCLTFILIFTLLCLFCFTCDYEEGFVCSFFFFSFSLRCARADIGARPRGSFSEDLLLSRVGSSSAKKKEEKKTLFSVLV